MNTKENFIRLLLIAQQGKIIFTNENDRPGGRKQLYVKY